MAAAAKVGTAPLRSCGRKQAIGGLTVAANVTDAAAAYDVGGEVDESQYKRRKAKY
jgi:hypothetical protein